MSTNLSKIYDLGKRANNGDEISLIKLIDIKSKFIKKVSYNDEDCYQFIIEALIKGIKNYKF